MQQDPFAGAAMLSAFLAAYSGFMAVISLLLLVSNWKIYSKAGRPGWAVIIPFYNIIVLLDIIKKPWWWLLLMIFLTPVFGLGIIWMIWATNLLAKAFGKGVGFTLGLLFLPIIFYPILAFDSSQYQLEENQYDY